MNITSKIVALSSAVAFALQIALALLMLRYFSPEEVGTFTVISQIGFFWTTLALAQTPLRLLANHGPSVTGDAREAWVSSLKRFIGLLPLATLVVWWSGLSFFYALVWALVLSLCQMTWMLAQSMRLRMVGAWLQAGVRMLPPLTALLFTSMAILIDWQGSALLYAALLGYAVGAVWLIPVLFASADPSPAMQTQASQGLAIDTLAMGSAPNAASITATSSDARSASLRIAHTFADAMLATAIVVVWQRLYGAQETGWMAAPLRVMGFIPAVVHMAWAQVLLAQPQSVRINPLWVGLGGFACVAILGSGCALALEMGWLGAQWHGVQPYLLPLVLWQGSACLAAAISYRPFEVGSASRYSWVCLWVVGVQSIVLLGPVVWVGSPILSLHFWCFSVVSAAGLITIAKYIR